MEFLWFVLLSPCAHQEDDSSKDPCIRLLYDQMGDGLVAELRLKRPNGVETVVKCFDGTYESQWERHPCPWATIVSHNL